MPFEIPPALGALFPLAFLLAVLVVARRLLRRLLARAIERDARASLPAAAAADVEPREAA